MVPLFFALLAFTKASPTEDLHPLSDAVINLINSQQDFWTAGRNFPENTPIQLLKKLNGVIQNGSRTMLPIKQHDLLRMGEELPEDFDPRGKWTFCPSLNEIRNQGACGSCWAVSAVAVMTDRYCIRSKGKKQFNFSAEDLLACSATDGCMGGETPEAWTYFVTKGIVSGGDYNSEQGCRPYRIPPSCSAMPEYCLERLVPTPACIEQCQEGYNVKYSEDKQFGDSAYMLVSDEQNIQSELFFNGPVEASFEVFDDFFNYKKGVYKHQWGELSGLHAVKIMGYGVENGNKYWLAANSWGDSWGDKGFFKIRRGVNECGIEEEVVTGQPRVSKVN